MVHFLVVLITLVVLAAVAFHYIPYHLMHQGLFLRHQKTDLEILHLIIL